MKPRPRILMLLANPWVMGDATLCAAFARQLRAARGPFEHAEVHAFTQPGGEPLLRRAGIRVETLAPSAAENEERIFGLCRRRRPDVVLLAELRNFLDQIFPEATLTPSEPFVENLRWDTVSGLGLAPVSFDNIPADGHGKIVRNSGLQVIVPVPPLDPERVRRLEGKLHLWNSMPGPAALPAAPPGKRLQVLLTLSEWSARLALERGLGLYYPILERQLVRVLGRLDRPVTLLVAGGPARYFGPRRAGRVQVRPLGPVAAANFDRLLFGADLLLGDHALQLSLVRRLRAGRPALLIRQTLRYEDRERPPFSMDPASALMLELWLKTRADTFWPWEIFPLPSQPALLSKEPFFRALPKADLFDGDGLLEACRVLLDAEGWRLSRGPMERLFERTEAEPQAAGVLQELLGSA